MLDNLYYAKVKITSAGAVDKLGGGEAITWVDSIYNTIILKNDDQYIDLFRPNVIFNGILTKTEPLYEIEELTKIYDNQKKLIRNK